MVYVNDCTREEIQSGATKFGTMEYNQYINKTVRRIGKLVWANYTLTAPRRRPLLH